MLGGRERKYEDLQEGAGGGEGNRRNRVKMKESWGELADETIKKGEQDGKKGKGEAK